MSGPGLPPPVVPAPAPRAPVAAPVAPEPEPVELERIRTKAINGFIAFAKKEIGLESEEAGVAILSALTGKVHPLVLGQVYRSRTQIRMIGQRLIKGHLTEEAKVKKVLDFLCSESGSHDFAIYRQEARDGLGLKIETPTDPEYALIRDLHKSFSTEMRLGEPLNPEVELAGKPTTKYVYLRAIIESSAGGSDQYKSEGTYARQQIQVNGVLGHAGSIIGSYTYQEPDYTRGLFEKRTVASLLTGEPEYIIPLGEETPEGWLTTGYPWEQINDPAHKAFVAAYQAKFNDTPRLGSLLGYVVGYMMKDLLDKAGSTDTDKMLAALDDLKSSTVVGPVVMRGLDHQSTLGAWVGETTKKDKKGTMKNWKYEDGAKYLFPEAEVKAARKQ